MSKPMSSYRKTRQSGLRVILALVALLMLSGCLTLPSCPQMPPIPAKPTLDSVTTNSQGGISLNREDTERLGRYILQLERGYQL